MSPVPTTDDARVLLALYDDEMRRHPSVPTGSRVEHDRGVIRVVGLASGPLDNAVVYADFGSESPDDVIARQAAYFRSLGRDVQWSVHGHDRPTDLEARLAHHGFTLESRETVLAMASNADVAPAKADSHVEIRRIATEPGLADVIAVQESVWGTVQSSWLLGWFRRSFAGTASPLPIFVAYVDGVPAAAAWVHLPTGRRMGSLHGGTVVEAHRGRGLYRALLVARLAAAREAHVPWLEVDANEQSRPILERLGFRRVTTRAEMVLRATS